MKPERWKRIDELFSAVLDLDADKRAAFLDEACAGDDALRSEVETLLASDGQSDSRFESLALKAAADLIDKEKQKLTPGISVGPYQILSMLGTGGMGEVYRARDPRIGRDVAIKILPSHFSQEPDRVRRFEQEARTAGTLNHPNILAIYDVGTENGSPYLVSELLEGETLRQRLGSPFAQRKAIEYAIQVARGLAAAHQKGIVHRDLKPENIFITKDGHIKILDFGLAKLVHPETPQKSLSELSTKTGVIMGTVGYMSPEQVSGQSVDHRSDIFSFGAILYEMLSGEKAFLGERSIEKMHAILNDDPRPIANVSLSLDRIVRDCLEKKPEERFQSARDLALALEAVSGASGTSTQAVPPQKRRFLRSTIATIVLVIAVALAFFAGKKAQPAKSAELSQPSYHRLTFRRGTIYSARFAPDGHTVVYSAAWDGNPVEIFTGFPESPESRPIGLSGAKLLSISRTGEMALLVRCRGNPSGDVGVLGTLARVSLSGGAPRELAEDVLSADWTPDGKNLVVIRHPDSRFRLEFPLGHVIYETGDIIRDLRVSPKGDWAAFAQAESDIVIIDQKGSKKVLSHGWNVATNIACNTSGDEVWFTADKNTVFPKELHAVTLAGKDRLILRSPIELFLQDVSQTNRILLTINNERSGIAFFAPQATKERELAWLDYSYAMDLSKDGKKVLINEIGEGTGGGEHIIYIRDTSGSPAIRMGEGIPTEFSPDGKWVTAIKNSGRQLLLIPTGADEPIDISRKMIDQYRDASWFPDGKRVIFEGKEKDHGFRVYVQDITGRSPPQVITPEDTSFDVESSKKTSFETEWSRPHPVSPDGKLVVVYRDGRYWLYPIDQGKPQLIPDLDPQLSRIVRWTPDSHLLYVSERIEDVQRVYLLNPFTGRKELWKDVPRIDPAGIVAIWPLLMSADGKSAAQNYSRTLSDLYLLEGIR